MTIAMIAGFAIGYFGAAVVLPFVEAYAKARRRRNRVPAAKVVRR